MGKAKPDTLLADLVAAFEDPHLFDDPPPVEELVATPETLRRARRMARQIDADPDVHPGRVALFVTAFDGLIAQRIEHIETQAESAVMQRLRARAAGLQGGFASRAPARRRTS